jgi:hypothetical protein
MPGNVTKELTYTHDSNTKIFSYRGGVTWVAGFPLRRPYADMKSQHLILPSVLRLDLRWILLTYYISMRDKWVTLPIEIDNSNIHSLLMLGSS